MACKSRRRLPRGRTEGRRAGASTARCGSGSTSDAGGREGDLAARAGVAGRGAGDAAQRVVGRGALRHLRLGHRGRFGDLRDTGIYLPPATSFEIAATEDADPRQLADVPTTARCSTATSQAAARRSSSRCDDRPVQRTGDRWYREVINADDGSTQVTQFVGGIPPGRAPDHFHLYEEVIVILDGTGAMWAGDVAHADRNRLVHLPPARAGALRREPRRRRDAPARRFLSGGKSGGAVSRVTKPQR